jgi:uncharacterized protein Veg
MRIESAYGKRLMLRSGNYTIKTLNTLVETYPSHGFVIDAPEAERLFDNVRRPTEEEDALRCALGEYAYIPTAKEAIRYLSDETKEAEIEEETKEEAEKGDAKEVKGECDEEAIKKTS